MRNRSHAASSVVTVPVDVLAVPLFQAGRSMESPCREAANASLTHRPLTNSRAREKGPSSHVDEVAHHTSCVRANKISKDGGPLRQ